MEKRAFCAPLRSPVPASVTLCADRWCGRL